MAGVLTGLRMAVAGGIDWLTPGELCEWNIVGVYTIPKKKWEWNIVTQWKCEHGQILMKMCAGVGGAGKLCLGTSWWGRCWGWPVLGGVVLLVGGDGGLSAVWVMETGAVLLVIAVLGCRVCVDVSGLAVHVEAGLVKLLLWQAGLVLMWLGCCAGPVCWAVLVGQVCLKLV